jgi:hypothetical protein
VDKDKLGLEIKTIMIDETKNIEMSQSLKDKILLHRKKTLREKINEFLNKEIQLPLIPVVGGLMLIILITSIPLDIMKSNNIKVINVGSSQMIFRDEKRVSRNDEN